jgi:hypothetical protein
VRLFLPEGWTLDAQPGAKAGIPFAVALQTKWQRALKLIEETQAWGSRCRVVLADAGYGEVAEFRQGLEARQLHSAAGVPSTLGGTRPPRLYKLKVLGRVRLRQVAEKVFRGFLLAGRLFRQQSDLLARRLVGLESVRGLGAECIKTGLEPAFFPFLPMHVLPPASA